MTHEKNIEEGYKQLLKNAPDHDSPEFLVYLMNNNVVVKDTFHWLVIENYKYHTKEHPHWTAFYKYDGYPSREDIGRLFLKHVPEGWKMFIKPADKRTVRRYHVHITKI